MANFRSSLPVILGFITIGVIFGVVLTTGFNLDSKSLAGPDSSESVYEEGAGEGQLSSATTFNPQKGFAGIVKKVRPAIVTIYTTKNVKVPANPWHQFFRGFGYEGAPDGSEQVYPRTGLGSGIIVSEDGYILTNHHVVKDVDELRVLMFDSQEYPAEVIGTDPETEVALIKIEKEGLTKAILGNSDQVEVGEWVLAIGSPLELNFSVTAGIVSALSRDINIIRSGGSVGGYAIENFIQTDAAINPGNSGGALVDTKGEVIGVNTAIKTETGTYIGYGFAVPINIAKTVMDDFIKFGEVRRGYIGVQIEPMTPVRAEGVGLDRPRGVFISSVLSGKAADKAGIEAGDVILRVEGQEVNQPNQLQAKVGSYNPGDEIAITLWRDGREVKYDIVLEARDDQIITAQDGQKEQKEEKLQALGIRVRDLSDEDLDQFDLSNGILIQSVDGNSAAAREGLRRGDVIYEVDGNEISSVSEFDDYVDDKDSGAILKIQTRTRFSNGSTSDRLVFLKLP
jgi:serine protease Do